MTSSIEFFYDIRSPYSYLASTQLGALRAKVRVRPMNITTLMEMVGNTPTTLTCKAKNAYAGQDLARWVHHYSVPFQPSNIMSTDADACARAVLAAQSHEEALAVAYALFANVWGEANTLGDSAAVLAALQQADIDTSGIAERIDAPETLAALRSNTEEAAQRGVFGAPTIFVGDAMFFGNDRLDFVRQALAQHEQVA